jgi:hypothetical protein
VPAKCLAVVFISLSGRSVDGSRMKDSLDSSGKNNTNTIGHCCVYKHCFFSNLVSTCSLSQNAARNEHFTDDDGVD